MFVYSLKTIDRFVLASLVQLVYENIKEKMKNKFPIVLIIIVLISLVPSLILSDINDDLQTMVKDINDFSFALFQELKEKKDNLFFSPYSISTALAMTYTGARGQTRKEMAEVLHFPLDQHKLHPILSQIQLKLNSIEEKGYIKLNIANSLWIQEGYHLRNEFVNVNKEYYNSELKFVDFLYHPEEAKTDINTWVEEKTNDKIKNLIGVGVLNPTTRLVLCNAIYLKSPWANQFDINDTKKAPFHLTSQENIQIDMMNQIEDFRYKDFDTFSSLELPYTSMDESFRGYHELSMIIFLPKKIDGLDKFEEGLNGSNVEQWINELMAIHPVEIIVSMPKFTTTSEFELANTLSEMGMPSAFRPGTADFSGMTGTKELFLDKAIHKAYVDINEKGTEAAAATALIMELGIAPDKPKPKKFIVDHPFIFLIRDNQTGSILFIGRIFDPTK